MASEQQHLEVAVELRDDADPDVAAAWLREHGLAVLPLAVGLLASGNADAVRDAFEAEPEGELPLPEALRPHVTSIAVVPPKGMSEGA